MPLNAAGCRLNAAECRPEHFPSLECWSEYKGAQPASRTVSPARARAFGIAAAGAVVNQHGSCSASAELRMVARIGAPAASACEREPRSDRVVAGRGARPAWRLRAGHEHEGSGACGGGRRGR